MLRALFALLLHCHQSQFAVNRYYKDEENTNAQITPPPKTLSILFKLDLQSCECTSHIYRTENHLFTLITSLKRSCQVTGSKKRQY